MGVSEDETLGTSLMVQRLRFYSSMAGLMVMGLIPEQEN